MNLRQTASAIIRESIRAVLPGTGVRKALGSIDFGESNIYVVAVGKAAFSMAKAAEAVLGERIQGGIVITKYGHVKGELEHFTCFEAGHPTPDEHSFYATERAIDLVEPLTEEDQVLFLLSGGASSLFEMPLIAPEELQRITDFLLRSGASIREINTVRKHLSAVKGGRFALACEPARVHSVVLSDVLGSPLSVIGSGPCYPDDSTGEDAFSVIEKYHVSLSADIIKLLLLDTPKELNNVETTVVGDVSMLCEACREACEAAGYRTVILTDELNCEAREAGAFLSSIARYYQKTSRSLAFIAGGETVVHVHGNGAGGRNQELALSAAEGIAGLRDTCIFSVGSDGTDGPTDAAGGIVDGETLEELKNAGIDPYRVLQENDAYHALKAVGGLIMTGPTGTNVNDVSVILINR